MRSVNQHDPRFTVGLAAMREVSLAPLPRDGERNVLRYLPGELCMPSGSEVMVIAEEHLVYTGQHEWVSMPTMISIVDASALALLSFAQVGVAELYARIPWPAPAVSSIRTLDYVFAVLDWEKLLARDAAIRLGSAYVTPYNPLNEVVRQHG